MTPLSAANHEDLRFRVLRLLQDNPEMSQREISAALGVSFGGVNYCLNALAEKGTIKIRNFRASNNKLRYAYVLTPQGLAEKTALTGRFLRRKMAEYEALRAEIEAVRGGCRLLHAQPPRIGVPRILGTPTRPRLRATTFIWCKIKTRPTVGPM